MRSCSEMGKAQARCGHHRDQDIDRVEHTLQRARQQPQRGGEGGGGHQDQAFPAQGLVGECQANLTQPLIRHPWRAAHGVGEDVGVWHAMGDDPLPHRDVQKRVRIVEDARSCSDHRRIGQQRHHERQRGSVCAEVGASASERRQVGRLPDCNPGRCRAASGPAVTRPSD